MRMEDLDPDRSRTEYASAALEDLRWLGIDWDEGPDLGGPFGPYAQSERHEIYLQAWKKLFHGGYIYPCRCSRKDLTAAISAPHEGTGLAQDPDDEPIYPGTCRPSRTGEGFLEISSKLADGPSQMNWRFRIPDNATIEFDDVNLGPQKFIAGIDFGDFLVWRRDNSPSYQLACVADDFAMRISEVVRGADLLKSTARQILLNRALGYANPAWFHCELVVDDKGTRLAKRTDALSIRELRRKGMSAAAVLSTPPAHLMSASMSRK